MQYRDPYSGQWAPEPPPRFNWGSFFLGSMATVGFGALAVAIYEGMRPPPPAAKPPRPLPPLQPAPGPVSPLPSGSTALTAPLPAAPVGSAPAATPTFTPEQRAGLAVIREALDKKKKTTAKKKRKTTASEKPVAPDAKATAVQRVEKLFNLAADERTPDNERNNAARAAAVAIRKNGLKVVPDGQT